jgi:hypothetical protein
VESFGGAIFDLGAVSRRGPAPGGRRRARLLGGERTAAAGAQRIVQGARRTNGGAHVSFDCAKGPKVSSSLVRCHPEERQRRGILPAELELRRRRYRAAHGKTFLGIRKLRYHQAAHVRA